MGDHHPLHGDMHGSGHELYAAHRRVHKWWDGIDQPVLFNQRYAHDIAIRDANGDTHAPFPPGGVKIVQSYYCWGKKVFAMAGGTVVHVVRTWVITSLQESSPQVEARAIASSYNTRMANLHLRSPSVRFHTC